MKRILFLEPHIDDLELSSSIFLNQLDKGTVLFLVTFCSGSGAEDRKERERIRNKNLFYLNQNIVIKEFNFYICPDNELDKFSMSEIIGRLQALIGDIEYDTIMIPWIDLHSDHRIVNNIGKVLGRKIPRVIEYQIQNSVYPNEGGRYFNLEYVMDYEKYKELDERLTCEGFNKNIDILRQKNYRKRNIEKYHSEITVSDRFNIIKDTRVIK